MAAQELLRRGDAAESLIAFTEYSFDRYRTGSHHRIIAEQLERVERREIDRLMLLLPPRHGKTELASRRYPAWCLGRNPTRQIIAASASKEFADDVGREVRNIIRDEPFKAVFPDVNLAEDSQAVGRWHTNQGGIFYAVGVGSQVLGKGADEFVIDDPFGSMEDAQSELERKRVREWYMGSVYNRLQPKGAIIVINHRMHEDDLSGFLLGQQAVGGDKWEVVELPAIDKAGSALWPEAYPVETLDRIRRNSLPRFWSALYQQRPAPEEGNYFKADWLRTYTSLPARSEMRVYLASDYAVTAGGGDYTVHIVVGVDPDGRMRVLDLWRGQTSSDEWIEAWCDLVKEWKPIEAAEESGQINAAIGPFLMRRARQRGAGVYRRQFPSRHDKAIRAQAIRGRMAMQGLYLPADKPWTADFTSELLSFPAGKHDDQVDALSLIGQLLDHISEGTKTPEEKKPSFEPPTLHQLVQATERFRNTRGPKRI